MAQSFSGEQVCVDEYNQPYAIYGGKCEDFETCVSSCRWHPGNSFPCDQNCPNYGNCYKCGYPVSCGETHSCLSFGLGDGDKADPPSRGGGGGGSGGTIYIKPGTRNDCTPQAKANSSKVIDVMGRADDGNTPVVNNINLLRFHASSAVGLEHGIAVNYDGNNGYYVLEHNGSLIQTGTATNVTVFYSKNTYMIAHCHPYPHEPSIGDASALMEAYKGGANGIAASVVLVSDKSEYMIYVDDRNAFSSFCNSSKSDDFLYNAPGSNSLRLRPGSDAEKEYNKAYNNMISNNYSERDARSYALTRVLSEYNTGMTISERKDKTGDFKEQKTTKDNSKYIPRICP